MNRRSFISIGAAALAGCSVLPAQEYQQRRDWPLVPRRSSALPPPRNGRVLLVRTMAAGPGLDARGVQWLLKDGSLNTDYYEQWSAPPAQAMEEGLRRWISDAGLFAAVVAPGSSVTPSFTLESELTALVANPQAGTARASLSLVLLQPKGDQSRVRLQRSVAAEVPMHGTGVEAIVAALREAATAALAQAETAIAGALRGG
jgi:cholesterol transport system auxiliary component